MDTPSEHIQRIIGQPSFETVGTPVFEASLSRVLRHTGNEFVIISADRRENTPAENVAARVALKAGLRQLSYGFVSIDGVGQETNPEGVVEPVVEKAYLVPKKRSGEPSASFLTDMLALAARFNQWGICRWKGDGTGSHFGGAGALLSSDGAVTDSFSCLHVGTSIFFSNLQQGRTRTRSSSFHLESVRKAPRASGLIEQQARSLRGELYSSIGAPATGPVDIDSI